MKPEYNDFIRNISLQESMGNCQHYSSQMVINFPELRIAQGFVILSNNKKYQHQWCVSPDTTSYQIVDPTVKQYTGYYVIGYEELKEDDPIPVGKCMNCGNWIMSNATDHTPFCSEKCWKEYINFHDL